jgi:hypothetical protein
MPRQKTVPLFIVELGSAPEQQDLQPGERAVRDYHQAGKHCITFQHRVTKYAGDTGRYSCSEDGELPEFLLQEYAGESLPVRVADAFAETGP